MERLDEVYAARTPEELRASYSRWAEGYDQDMVEGLGWDKPHRVGELIMRHTSASAAVLDAGAGTGLLGKFLAGHGYRDLTALDFTPAMLEQARQRGVYRALLEMDLNQPLALESESFEVVAAVGIFTDGHLGPGCLPELARVSRRLLALSLRDDLYSHYASALARLELVEKVGYADGLEGRPWTAWLFRVR